MAKQLSPATVQIIRQYIDEGLPLENLDMSNANRERVRVAERCYERLQQDPWLDRNRYLMRVEGRTRQQALLDMQVVDMFMEALNTTSRQLVEHRRDVTLQRLARGAEQVGDLKLLERTLTHIEKQLTDMGDDKTDVVKNTAALPAVLVGVEYKDPNKHALDDKSFVALLEKYNGKPDQIDAMVMERRQAILLESQRNSAQYNTGGQSAYMQEVTPEQQHYKELAESSQARIAELERQLRIARGEQNEEDVLSDFKQTVNDLMYQGDE